MDHRAQEEQARSPQNPVERHVEVARLIRGGKRVGDAAYLHTSLLAQQDPAVRDLVANAVSLTGVEATGFNVVRIALRRAEVALLNYASFFDAPFPTLQTSWLADLSAGRVTVSDFSKRENPPILHRKELLLAAGDPHRAVLERLTAALEDYGAFDHPSHLIGHRSYWERALTELGLHVDGHEVTVNDATAPDVSSSTAFVARHRTAIARNRLSAPMQALARWGFLDGVPTVLDYGCGRGDDVRTLAGAGLDARGWDPYFAPDVPLVEADVTNLGFVLNVIEDPSERAEALRAAYKLTRQVLSVAVMLTGKGSGANHADGVLTKRGTFQKYFTQSEFREYVAGVLERDPVPIGPGIVFVFRSDEDEQAFLARRQRSSVSPPDRFDVLYTPRGPSSPRQPIYERYQELLDAFWASTLELGRFPETDEFTRMGELRSAVGSPRKAFSALPFSDKEEELSRVAMRRKEDLLVYLALNIFERRSSFHAMPIAVQRDIRAFLGSHKAALEQASSALFTAGDRERTAHAAAAAAAQGLGVLDAEDGDYTFHTSFLTNQPAPLRIVLGCAERLEPLTQEVDLIKIHGSGDRVSYLRFENFQEKFLPVLAGRTIINLRAQRVSELSVNTPDGRRILLGKARFMPLDAPNREQQERFDAELRHKGVLEREGLGPGLREFARQLTAAGVKLQSQPSAAGASQQVSAEKASR